MKTVDYIFGDCTIHLFIPETTTEADQQRLGLLLNEVVTTLLTKESDSYGEKARYNFISSFHQEAALR